MSDEDEKSKMKLGFCGEKVGFIIGDTFYRALFVLSTLRIVSKVGFCADLSPFIEKESPI